MSISAGMFETLFNSYCSVCLRLKWSVQKSDFLGPHLGGPPRVSPKKNSGDKIALAAQQVYTKILKLCGLGEEERTRFRKKKKRNEPNRGQKWVSRNERVSSDI